MYLYEATCGRVSPDVTQRETFNQNRVLTIRTLWPGLAPIIPFPHKLPNQSEIFPHP